MTGNKIEYDEFCETYEIIEIIGSGTQGVVFSAKNKKTNEKIAIKKVCALDLNEILKEVTFFK
jgi:serine/threonine protein kinase